MHTNAKLLETRYRSSMSSYIHARYCHGNFEPYFGCHDSFFANINDCQTKNVIAGKNWRINYVFVRKLVSLYLNVFMGYERANYFGTKCVHRKFLPTLFS